MNFNIGDIVVCVDDSMQSHVIEELKKDVPNWVKKDNKYTIRAILNNRNIVTGLLLEEISNPPLYFDLIGGFQEPAFAEFRFRKLKPNENMVENVKEVLEIVQ
jgi:hypothetical protein